MPIPAILLLIATLLPLAGFLLLLFLGKRMGTPLAGYVGSAFIGASFIFSIVAMIQWYGGGSTGGQTWGFEKSPINLPLRWLPIATSQHANGIAQEIPGWLDIGIFIDSLTITMFSMVTLVATLVHIFSIGYMQEDGRYPRFFAYLGLFSFSMLGLVLGGTLLHILIFWELVGFCSYLLIGFWFEKKAANNAAIKAFVANRVGDVGFVVGLSVLFYQLGNSSLPHLWILLSKAGAGQTITLPNGGFFSTGWLTITGICLIFGAIGKSAQFPLHVWLADAMEGPTPVSALIHAATMVAAGVYLLGRIFPILTPDAKMFAAIIGLITLTMGALIAVVQTDIKKVLAFSTMSQLGYMLLAMGVGSWVGGLFHLMTHAFFKALLFLSAGSVIRAADHEQEMGQYGGLWRKIPVTAFCFLIGVLAISGVGFGKVGLSGYYSKDMILQQAGAFANLAIHLGRSRMYLLLFWVPACIAFVTPFYMMRCWMLTFAGKPRHAELHADAVETPIMWGPLVLLSLLALLSGRFMSIQELLDGSIQENNAYCRQFDPNFAGFDTAWPDVLPDERAPDQRSATDLPSASQLAQLQGNDLVENHLSFWTFTIGLTLAIMIYLRGFGVARLLLKIPFVRPIHRWLYARMYFDELYFGVFVATVYWMAELCAWIDRAIIDKFVETLAAGVRQSAAAASWVDDNLVNGSVTAVGSFANQIGGVARATQTGRIRGYVTLLLAALAIAVALGVIVALSK